MNERSLSGGGPGCEGCLFLARQDTGYSNYTVEDTEVWCLQSANPNMPPGRMIATVESEVFDNALAYGQVCRERVPGDGAWYDVDGTDVTDESYKDNTVLYEAIKAWRLLESLRNSA